MATKRPVGKALRAAIVVSIVTLVATFPLNLGNNAFYASLSAILLLMFADFSGPLPLRSTVNIVVGLVCMALITIGNLAASSLIATLIVSAIVSFAVAYAVVLRGYFGAAYLTLLLSYVVAVTGPVGLDVLPSTLLCFGAGVVVAAIAAVTMWPHHTTSDLRKAVGRSLLCSAKLVADSRPLSANATDDLADRRMRELVAAHQALDEIYVGHLARPGSGTARDRGLVQLIDDITRLRVSLRWPSDKTTKATPSDLALLKATEEALDASGNAMLGNGPVPSPDAILCTRMDHIRSLPDRAGTLLASHEGEELKEEVNASFYYRMTAFLTAMTVRHTQVALGHRVKESEAVLKGYPNAETVARIDAATSPWAILKSNFTPKSPWFRRALQTSIAVTAAIVIAQILQLQFGFWVVLGITAALGLQASDTRKSIVSAVAGTLVGYIVVLILTAIVGRSTLPLVILLPIIVFLVIWVPSGRLALFFKQLGYTVLFILLVGLASGLTMQVGDIRLQDIGIGLAICFVVASVLWPRGIAAEVRAVIADSVRTAAEYFVESYRFITSPMQEEDFARLHTAEKSATKARILAADEYDVAVTQGGQVREEARTWSTVANTVDHTFVTSVLIGSVQRFGLAPVPIESVAHQLRTDSNDVAEKYVNAINATYTLEAGDSKSRQSRLHKKSATPTRPHIDPNILHPYVDSHHDLAELVTKVDRALKQMDGHSGSFTFEIDHQKFETSYANAAISLLWAQDWIFYFHWMATQTLASEQSSNSIA